MKKRLTFEINEELHSRLKAEAAQQGVSLGSHCSAILAGEKDPSPPAVKFDAAKVSSLPLNDLRAMCANLSENKPEGWQRSLNLLNTEIRRRYRI